MLMALFIYEYVLQRKISICQEMECVVGSIRESFKQRARIAALPLKNSFPMRAATS